MKSFLSNFYWHMAIFSGQTAWEFKENPVLTCGSSTYTLTAWKIAKMIPLPKRIKFPTNFTNATTTTTNQSYKSIIFCRVKTSQRSPFLVLYIGIVSHDNLCCAVHTLKRRIKKIKKQTTRFDIFDIANSLGKCKRWEREEGVGGWHLKSCLFYFL